MCGELRRLAPEVSRPQLIGIQPVTNVGPRSGARAFASGRHIFSGQCAMRRRTSARGERPVGFRLGGEGSLGGPRRLAAHGWGTEESFKWAGTRPSGRYCRAGSCGARPLMCFGAACAVVAPSQGARALNVVILTPAEDGHKGAQRGVPPHSGGLQASANAGLACQACARVLSAFRAHGPTKALGGVIALQKRDLLNGCPRHSNVPSMASGPTRLACIDLSLSSIASQCSGPGG